MSSVPRERDSHEARYLDFVFDLYDDLPECWNYSLANLVSSVYRTTTELIREMLKIVRSRLVAFGAVLLLALSSLHLIRPVVTPSVALLVDSRLRC